MKNFWKRVFHRENSCMETQDLELKGQPAGSQNDAPGSARLLGLLACEPVQGFCMAVFWANAREKGWFRGCSCWRRKEGYAAASTFDTVLWDGDRRPFNFLSHHICCAFWILQLKRSPLERGPSCETISQQSQQSTDMFQRPNPGLSSELRAR